MGKERSNIELKEKEEKIISTLRDNIISGIGSKVKFLAPWQPWQKGKYEYSSYICACGQKHRSSEKTFSWHYIFNILKYDFFLS